MDWRVIVPARVVITGLGVIAGPHSGAAALRVTLQQPVMHTADVGDAHGYGRPGGARRAVLCRGVDLSPWLPAAAARRMSPPSRLAVAASRMALADAGLADQVAGGRTGVVMASAFGAVTSTEELLDAARRLGPQAVPPFAFAESVANAAAGQVAIAVGAQGPNITVIQREAGALTAIGRGAEMIASGRADRVLAGAVDELSPLLHALLGRFDALAPPNEVGAEIARPFDPARTGFVAAEGAAVAVLEREAIARERGAPILARVRGFGGSFDPTAPRIGWGHGHDTLAAGLARTVAMSGVDHGDVSRIVSGASGAVAGDRIEAAVLRAAWGDRPLPIVLAPKGQVGQYGGGFLAAAVLSAAGGVFGRTGGFVQEDPALGVRPFEGGLLDSASLTLVTTVASGGSAAWLLIEAA